MAQVKVLVLRAAGTNCDLEMCYAFELAGAKPDLVHVNRLIEEPHLLERYQILALPGGFSYGDDIAAGKILANQLVHHFRRQVQRFVDDKKLVLGVCNGFQVLVKAGLLPAVGTQPAIEGADNNGILQQATITYNDSGKFEDRWTYLQPGTNKCVFIDPERRIYLPIAHGEGKVCFADESILQQVQADQVAFRYVDEAGQFGAYPVNPNGSVDHIAGLCDTTGRVLGLMPHPERFVHPTQHPRWTRQQVNQPDGLAIFVNAMRYFD